MRILNNGKKWSSYSLIQQYALCGTVLLGAYLLTRYVFPIIAMTRPYSLFLMASYLMAILCGLWPGIFTCAVGYVLVNYQFIHPVGELNYPSTHEDFVDIVVILLLSIIIIYLIDKYQSERYKNKLFLLVSDSRYRILLHRENQRLIALKKLQF